MNLWYFNIDHFPIEEIAIVANSVPIEISQEINRYRLSNDRKSRLVARLLIQRYILRTMNTWNWRDWKINDKNKKHFLENGPCFYRKLRRAAIHVVVTNSPETCFM